MWLRFKLCFDDIEIICEFSLMFMMIKVKKNHYVLLEIMKHDESK